MTTTLYGTALTAPAEEEAEWVGMAPTWTGWDGSVFGLSRLAGGVLLARGGTRGLNMPPVTRYTSSAPGVAGTRNRGYRFDERPIFWPLFIHHVAGSAAFAERDRAFWRTMHPGKPGVWRVTLPDGATRSLRCRYADDGGHAFDLLPTVQGWALYGIDLVAEDPFWRGDLVLRAWRASTPSSFFGGGGPPFHISSSSRLAGATMSNPGDEDGFPLWVVDGPTTTAQVGVGSAIIDIPFAIPGGESLVIDTAPASRQARTMPSPPADATPAEVLAHVEANAGVAVTRTRNLGATTAFAPIPAGESQNLTLATTGGSPGAVRVVLEPLYHRAL